MSRFRSTATITLALIAALRLAGPAAAGEYVPFKGKLQGDVTRTPAPPLVMVDINAKGNATHLGRFTLDVPHFVDPMKGMAAGIYQFTAANGDVLCAEFSGQASPTDELGVLYIEETATITGGTGRFAGATGSFVVERYFDTVAGTTIGSFEGTISRGGS